MHVAISPICSPLNRSFDVISEVQSPRSSYVFSQIREHFSIKCTKMALYFKNKLLYQVDVIIIKLEASNTLNLRNSSFKVHTIRRTLSSYPWRTFAGINIKFLWQMFRNWALEKLARGWSTDRFITLENCVYQSANFFVIPFAAAKSCAYRTISYTISTTCSLLSRQATCAAEGISFELPFAVIESASGGFFDVVYVTFALRTHDSSR